MRVRKLAVIEVAWVQVGDAAKRRRQVLRSAIGILAKLVIYIVVLRRVVEELIGIVHSWSSPLGDDGATLEADISARSSSMARSIAATMVGDTKQSAKAARRVPMGGMVIADMPDEVHLKHASPAWFGGCYATKARQPK